MFYIVFGRDDSEKLILSHTQWNDEQAFLQAFYETLLPEYEYLHSEAFRNFCKKLFNDELPTKQYINWGYKIYKKDNNYELENTLTQYRNCDARFILKNKKWYKVDEEFRLVSCKGKFTDLSHL